MAGSNQTPQEHAPGPGAAKRRYLWPRYVWGAVVLGILIAIFAVRKEARRIRDSRIQEDLPAAREINSDSKP